MSVDVQLLKAVEFSEDEELKCFLMRNVNVKVLPLFLFLFLFRLLGFSTSFSGLGTSGLSSRRPVGTRVLRGWQVGRLRNRPAPSPRSPTTRVALTRQGATTPRGTLASRLSTARLEGPPPTPIKCSRALSFCEWHFCIFKPGQSGGDREVEES